MSGLFSKPKMPEMPAPPPPPPVMPIPDDEAVKSAKRRALQLQRSRKGRRSTVLSESGDITTLGG